MDLKYVFKDKSFVGYFVKSLDFNIFNNECFEILEISNINLIKSNIHIDNANVSIYKANNINQYIVTISYYIDFNKVSCLLKNLKDELENINKINQKDLGNNNSTFNYWNKIIKSNNKYKIEIEFELKNYFYFVCKNNKNIFNNYYISELVDYNNKDLSEKSFNKKIEYDNLDYKVVLIPNNFEFNMSLNVETVGKSNIISKHNFNIYRDFNSEINNLKYLNCIFSFITDYQDITDIFIESNLSYLNINLKSYDSVNILDVANNNKNIDFPVFLNNIYMYNLILETKIQSNYNSLLLKEYILNIDFYYFFLVLISNNIISYYEIVDFITLQNTESLNNIYSNLYLNLTDFLIEDKTVCIKNLINNNYWITYVLLFCIDRYLLLLVIREIEKEVIYKKSFYNNKSIINMYKNNTCITNEIYLKRHYLNKSYDKNVKKINKSKTIKSSAIINDNIKLVEINCKIINSNILGMISSLDLIEIIVVKFKHYFKLIKNLIVAFGNFEINSNNINTKSKQYNTFSHFVYLYLIKNNYENKNIIKDKIINNSKSNNVTIQSIYSINEFKKYVNIQSNYIEAYNCLNYNNKEKIDNTKEFLFNIRKDKKKYSLNTINNTFNYDTYLFKINIDTKFSTFGIPIREKTNRTLRNYTTRESLMRINIKSKYDYKIFMKNNNNNNNCSDNKRNNYFEQFVQNNINNYNKIMKDSNDSNSDSNDNYNKLNFNNKDFNEQDKYKTITSYDISSSFYKFLLRRGILICFKLIDLNNCIYNSKNEIVRYNFFGYSNSQFRKKSAWICIDSDYIRSKAGNFSQYINSTAKKGARLGQCLSSTLKGIEIPSNIVKEIKDRYDFSFNKEEVLKSDGSSYMSESMAIKIANYLDLSNVPSSFQARFMGCKGMWSIMESVNSLTNSDINNCGNINNIKFEILKDYICIRPSQNKFISDFYEFEICDYSKYRKAYLNRQIINLLTTLGVKDDYLLKKLSEDLNVITDSDRFVDFISNNYVKNILKQMIGYKEDIINNNISSNKGIKDDFLNIEISKQAIVSKCNITPENDLFLLKMMKVNYELMCSILKNKSKIYIKHSTIMKGIIDEYGLLDENEAYATVSISNNKNDIERNFTLVGDLLVTRCPCYHPGDIRKIKFVDFDIQDNKFIDNKFKRDNYINKSNLDRSKYTKSYKITPDLKKEYNKLYIERKDATNKKDLNNNIEYYNKLENEYLKVRSKVYDIKANIIKSGYMKKLINVLVFSARGRQCLPSLMSGGDLDGDDYFIFWDDELLKVVENNPFDYNLPNTLTSNKRIISNSIKNVYKDYNYEFNYNDKLNVEEHLKNTLDFNDVIDLFIDYKGGDSLGKISNKHNVIVDVSPLKANDNDALLLVELASRAVDSAKTGEVVDIPISIKNNEKYILYPHYMNKLPSKSYKSNSILGKLYDAIVDNVKKSNNFFDIKESKLLNNLNYDTIKIKKIVNYNNYNRILERDIDLYNYWRKSYNNKLIEISSIDYNKYEIMNQEEYNNVFMFIIIVIKVTNLYRKYISLLEELKIKFNCNSIEELYCGNIDIILESLDNNILDGDKHDLKEKLQYELDEIHINIVKELFNSLENDIDEYSTKLDTNYINTFSKLNIIQQNVLTAYTCFCITYYNKDLIKFIKLNKNFIDYLIKEAIKDIYIENDVLSDTIIQTDIANCLKDSFNKCFYNTIDSLNNNDLQIYNTINFENIYNNVEELINDLKISNINYGFPWLTSYTYIKYLINCINLD